MRTYTLLRHLLPVLAASLIVASAPLASAQGAGQGQGRRGGGGGAAFQNMSDEQREAMQQVNQEITDQAAKVRQARIDLNGAIYAAKVDEAAIKAKVAALAKAEEDQASQGQKPSPRFGASLTTSKLKRSRTARGGGRAAPTGAGRRGGNY